MPEGLRFELSLTGTWENNLIKYIILRNTRMPHITLSIPDSIYRLMRKYKEVNWSEVARKAIIRRLLSMKASREGLTREELAVLLESMNISLRAEDYGYERETEFLERIKERERRRLELLKRLEEQ